MLRPWRILTLGLLAGALAFAATFWLKTRHHARPTPAADLELEWLRREFHLPPATFERIVSLHRDYQPTCAELCRRIEDRNARLRDAVARTNILTDEIRALVQETGRVRDECRQAMLAHLYAVSREMPEPAAQRYLQLMLGATCILQDAHPIDTVRPSTSTPTSTAGGHGHHD